MTPEELKTEFRGLVVELKEAVQTENQEAISKINERMDQIELEVKKLVSLSSQKKKSPLKCESSSSRLSFLLSGRASARNL